MSTDNINEINNSDSNKTTAPLIQYYKKDWTGETCGNIYRKVLIPLLNKKVLTYNELSNLTNSEYCKNNFGLEEPLISYNQKAPFYIDKVKIRNHDYFAYKEWKKDQKDFLIDWIVENNYIEIYEDNRWEKKLTATEIIQNIIAPLISLNILDNQSFAELQNPLYCKRFFAKDKAVFPYDYNAGHAYNNNAPKATIKNNIYYYDDNYTHEQRQLLIYWLYEKLDASDIQHYYETICANYQPYSNPTKPEFIYNLSFHTDDPYIKITTEDAILNKLIDLILQLYKSADSINKLQSLEYVTKEFGIQETILIDKETYLKNKDYCNLYCKDSIELDGQEYYLKQIFDSDNHEQLINWFIIHNITTKEQKAESADKPKPKKPVVIPPRIKHIIDISGQESDDELEQCLEKMGRAWFVTYAYYIYKDSSYRRWEMAGTLPNRIQRFKKSIRAHFKWLSELAINTTANYRDNQVQLDNSQVRKLATAILETSENKRYENCNKYL